MAEKKRHESASSKYCAAFVLFLVYLSLPTIAFAETASRPLDLDTAYALAIENHELIQIAATVMAKNKLLPKKARTLMMPRLGIEGTYRKANKPIEFVPEIAGFRLPPVETIPEDQLVGRFNFTQPIYEGEYFPLKRKSQQLIEGGSEYYRKTVQDILFNVAESYYEVFKARELVNNAHEVVVLNKEALRVAKTRFNAGDVTEDVVLRAELNLTQAESTVIKSTNQLKIAEDFLKRLIGAKDRELDLAEPAEKVRVNRTYEELVKTALENRHDYQMSLTNIQVAETNIEVAKSRFHPRLKGTWDYYKLNNPSFFQEDDYWVAEVKLEITLFDGGMKYLNLKEQRENLTQAKLESENLKDTIMNELKNAFLTESNYNHILRNSEKRLRLAVKNHEITFSKFKYGAATILELDQAVAILASAKSEQITNKYNRQIHLLKLEKATGVFAKDYIDRTISALP